MFVHIWLIFLMWDVSGKDTFPTAILKKYYLVLYLSRVGSRCSKILLSSCTIANFMSKNTYIIFFFVIERETRWRDNRKNLKSGEKNDK